MGWRDSFKKIFTASQEIKASKTGPLLVQFGLHQPRFTPRQYDRLADEGYLKNIIAYRCVSLISQSAAAVPFVLYHGSGSTRVRLDDHPLLRLLHQPNPMQGGASFFESVYSFYLIAGNSYIETVGPWQGMPRELWALRPDRMRIVPGVSGVPEAYRYSVGGKSVDYRVDPVTGRSQVLHMKSFHPLDDWYGMSPLEAAAVSIDQHNDAAKWNASLLQSSGRPSGALVYRPQHADASATLTPEQRGALKSELENFFSGEENAGRPLVLEGGLDWKEMSLSPKDMDWLAGKDVSAREIALAFHVPAQLVGINGSLTFSNFEQARLALFDDAVLPLLDRTKDELNSWLVPLFGDDLTLDYDLDKIEALSLRRQQVWDRLKAVDFLTVNEKRRELGYGPVPDGDAMKGA